MGKIAANEDGKKLRGAGGVGRDYDFNSTSGEQLGVGGVGVVGVVVVVTGVTL